MDKIYKQQFFKKSDPLSTFQSIHSDKKHNTTPIKTKPVYHNQLKEFQLETAVKCIDKRIWKQLHTKLNQFYKRTEDSDYD